MNSVTVRFDSQSHLPTTPSDLTRQCRNTKHDHSHGYNPQVAVKDLLPPTRQRKWCSGQDAFKNANCFTPFKMSSSTLDLPQLLHNTRTDLNMSGKLVSATSDDEFRSLFGDAAILRSEMNSRTRFFWKRSGGRVRAAAPGPSLSELLPAGVGEETCAIAHESGKVVTRTPENNHYTGMHALSVAESRPAVRTAMGVAMCEPWCGKRVNRWLTALAPDQ